MHEYKPAFIGERGRQVFEEHQKLSREDAAREHEAWSSVTVECLFLDHADRVRAKIAALGHSPFKGKDEAECAELARLLKGIYP